MMRRPPGARQAPSVNFAAAGRTALVVGTILTYLNTRGLASARTLDWPLVERYAMNCMVPFAVSVYSQWSMSRRLRSRSMSASRISDRL